MGNQGAEKSFQHLAYKWAGWTGVPTYFGLQPWLSMPMSGRPHSHVPAQALPVLMKGKQGSPAHSPPKSLRMAWRASTAVGGTELSSWSTETADICFYGSA